LTKFVCKYSLTLTEYLMGKLDDLNKD